MFRVKETPFKIRILYRGDLLHAMDVNIYEGASLKSYNIYKLKIN